MNQLIYELIASCIINKCKLNLVAVESHTGTLKITWNNLLHGMNFLEFQDAEMQQSLTRVDGLSMSPQGKLGLQLL